MIIKFHEVQHYATILLFLAFILSMASVTYPSVL